MVSVAFYQDNIVFCITIIISLLLSFNCLFHSESTSIKDELVREMILFMQLYGMILFYTRLGIPLFLLFITMFFNLLLLLLRMNNYWSAQMNGFSLEWIITAGQLQWIHFTRVLYGIIFVGELTICSPCWCHSHPSCRAPCSRLHPLCLAWPILSPIKVGRRPWSYPEIHKSNIRNCLIHIYPCCIVLDNKLVLCHVVGAILFQ